MTLGVFERTHLWNEMVTSADASVNGRNEPNGRKGVVFH